MYELFLTKQFKKDSKKINQDDLKHTMEVLNRLSKGETLESKYKDHALSGSFSHSRDCHIRPDLILIYEKKEELLILKALRIGKHSDIFK